MRPVGRLSLSGAASAPADLLPEKRERIGVAVIAALARAIAGWTTVASLAFRAAVAAH